MPTFLPVIRKNKTALIVSALVVFGLAFTITLALENTSVASALQKPSPAPAPFQNTAVQEYNQALQEMPLGNTVKH